jgi:CelD/BcsL family acetyltransferase involved in cellulose biosynthesis
MNAITGRPLTIEPIRSEADFDGLEREWNALLAQSPADTPFLTWEWLRTWWRCFGRDLRLNIVAVRADGRLVALAPLCMRGWEWRRLRLFRRISLLGAPLPTGNVGSDYLDLVVAAPGEGVEALVSVLAAAGRALDLTPISKGASTVDRVARRLTDAGWTTTETEVGLCPIVDLAGQTWESYLATLRREHRYTVGRKLRKLQKDFDVTFEAVRDEADRRAALGHLIALHEQRWREKGESDAFHTPALRSFHEEFTRLALARGWLRLYLLKLDGAPAAALYGLRYGETFHFYQSGFDPRYARYGVGVATMALSIEAALAEGTRRYDMLHGTEEYKFHWANTVRPLVRYELYPPTARGACARGLTQLYSALRPMARRMLSRQRHVFPKAAGPGIGTGEAT